VIIDGLRSPLDAAESFEEDPKAAAAFMRQATDTDRGSALAAIGVTQLAPPPEAPAPKLYQFESDVKALQILLKQERKLVVGGEVVTMPGINVPFREYRFQTFDEETAQLMLHHPKQGVGKLFWLESEMKDRVREAKKAELLARISGDELLRDPEVQAALRVRLGSEDFPTPPAAT